MVMGKDARGNALKEGLTNLYNDAAMGGTVR